MCTVDVCAPPKLRGGTARDDGVIGLRCVVSGVVTWDAEGSKSAKAMVCQPRVKGVSLAVLKYGGPAVWMSLERFKVVAVRAVADPGERCLPWLRGVFRWGRSAKGSLHL